LLAAIAVKKGEIATAWISGTRISRFSSRLRLGCPEQLRSDLFWRLCGFCSDRCRGLCHRSICDSHFTSWFFCRTQRSYFFLSDRL